MQQSIIVSSLPAQSMLNKPASKAVETVLDQEQQAMGVGVDQASSEAEEGAESAQHLWPAV